MLPLIHPALVHFPIALLVVGGTGEAAGLLLDRRSLARFGGLLVILGSCALLPTLATGYLAANATPLAGEARAVLERHELIGWIIGGWFIAALFWKGWMRGEITGGQRAPYALMLLLGVALVIYSALLGGELVYAHGVGRVLP